MSTTISSKLAALAAALLINGFIMGAVGYMFETQSHPHMSLSMRQTARHIQRQAPANLHCAALRSNA